MKNIRNILIKIIRFLSELGGAIIFIWYILSYFNIAPFYEIRLIPTNSVDPYINVFSGQDIQLDFNQASYYPRSEIQKVTWEVSDGSYRYPASGLRPIIKLQDSYEGIYNLSLEVSLMNNKVLRGKTNIYVVQQKTNIIQKPKTIQFNIGKQTPSGSTNYFFPPEIENANIQKIEIYSDNNKWINKDIIKEQGNSYSVTLSPLDQIKTVNDKIIMRYQS
ncbi:TPA: hypothetical protein ACT9MN_001686, partial [Legionella pneumophila]